MERKTTKRYKHFHHHLGRLHGKYKRYAAAVAGAAIMAGVALPGIPSAKVLAAENPSAEQITLNQTNAVDKDKKTGKKVFTEKSLRNDHKPPGSGWHEHKYSWPSPDENQAWVEDGRIYYRSDNRQIHEYDVNYLYSPVNIVKNNAEMYGFNPYRDSFRLLTMSNDKALVEVTRNDIDRLFNVLLTRTGNQHWQITEVRVL